MIKFKPILDIIKETGGNAYYESSTRDENYKRPYKREIILPLEATFGSKIKLLIHEVAHLIIDVINPKDNTNLKFKWHDWLDKNDNIKIWFNINDEQKEEYKKQRQLYCDEVYAWAENKTRLYKDLSIEKVARKIKSINLRSIEAPRNHKHGDVG